jgi:hypothetical protein
MGRGEANKKKLTAKSSAARENNPDFSMGNAAQDIPDQNEEQEGTGESARAAIVSPWAVCQLASR